MNTDMYSTKSLDRFLKEVSYAYDQVPFYGTKLKSLGIDLNGVTTDNFADVLPFTEKRDYRKNFPKGVLANGFTLNHPMLTKSQSSGTTGERLITFEIGMNLLQRAMNCAQIHPEVAKAFTKPGRKICRYAAPNCSDVECANPHSSLEDRLLADGTLVLPVFHDLLTTNDTLIERAIDEILTYQPDLFYVDPTHFAFLLKEFEKRNITPPDIPVLTSYSAATRVSLRQIEKHYPRSQFSELLSSSEMGWTAMTCPKGQMHLNDSSYFIELLPYATDSGPSPWAEMCISSIDQGAVPHLRYKTGDMVSLAAPQESENGLGRQIKIEGRLSHFITQSGLPVMSPNEVDQLIGAPPWLFMYQLEQHSDERFTLKCICHDSAESGDLSHFVAGLSERLQVKADIAIEHLSYIAAERSGKFQFVKGLQA